MSHTDCLSTIERFIWDGDQLVAEVRREGGDGLPAGALNSDNDSGDYYGKVLYVHGGEIDQPLAIIRKSHPSESFVVPHADYRGTYLDGTDENRNRVSCAPYSYGCVNIDWPGWYRRTYHDSAERGLSEWFGSLIFSQQDATGLMYKRNRYYDPHTGRFTQTDPVGLAGGLNLYGYANGDPVTFSDPFGLKVEFADDRLREAWDRIRNLARSALDSDDDDVRHAGMLLLSTMESLESAEETYTIGFATKAATRERAGAWTNLVPRGGGDVATWVNKDYWTGSSQGHQQEVVAHETGHALAFFLNARPKTNTWANATHNAFRTLANCPGSLSGHNQWSSVGGPCQ